MKIKKRKKDMVMKHLKKDIHEEKEMIKEDKGLISKIKKKVSK
jgi:hypothetical protein